MKAALVVVLISSEFEWRIAKDLLQRPEEGQVRLYGEQFSVALTRQLMQANNITED